MTELMKQYEAETGKSARDELYSGSMQLYMPSNDYIQWLETKVEDEKRRYQQLDEMYIVVSRAEVNQRKEAEKLKAQLRWRPASEKPEKEDFYFIKCRFSNPDIGTKIHDLTARWVNGEWKNMKGLTVLCWLPIPPAPEGEKYTQT